MAESLGFGGITVVVVPMYTAHHGTVVRNRAGTLDIMLDVGGTPRTPPAHTYGQVSHPTNQEIVREMAWTAAAVKTCMGHIADHNPNYELNIFVTHDGSLRHDRARRF